MAMPLQKLYLIRHGDTDWTESHRHTGLTDIPLNARGEAHALTISERLAGVEFAHVYTSPLARAHRTSEIAGFGNSAEVEPDLVEWDYGAFEGMTTAEIKIQQPHWNLFRDGVPDGETPCDVAGRADRFLAKVKKIEGNVAAFSSGHFIRMIAARWLDLIPLQAAFFYTATATIGVLGYEHNLSEPVIMLWNEDQHI